MKKPIRQWTIFDGCSKAPTITGPSIAYAETIRVVELEEYERVVKERNEAIERKHFWCREYELLAKRIEELEADIESRDPRFD